MDVIHDKGNQTSYPLRARQFARKINHQPTSIVVNSDRGDYERMKKAQISACAFFIRS